MKISSFHIKTIATVMLWTLVGAAGLLLLLSGKKRKSDSICSSTQVSIHGVGNHFFVDKADVIQILEKVHGKKLEGTRVESINIEKMEQELKKDQWIEKAELYFDKNDRLMVEIEEKNPVARIFMQDGNSFYMDYQLQRLPLTNKHAVRLPVFTGFPSGLVVLSKTDSFMLKDIRKLSLHIQKDPFLMSMIEQININEKREFELVPKVGDQLILLGNSRNYEKKFKKMKLFYQQIIPLRGWNYFHKINLKYEGQVVATLKGKEEIKYDSLLTMRMIKTMADFSSNKANDTTQAIQPDNTKSTDVSMVMTSFEREEPSTTEVISVQTNSTDVNTKPVLKAVESKASVNKPVIKKEEKKKAKETDKPKEKPKPKDVQVKRSENKSAPKKTNTNEY